MQTVTNLFPSDFEEYQAIRRERGYLLVDVRQPFEYAQGHIPGAMLMPLPEVETRLDELGTEKDLVVYCRTGGRSAVAAALIDDAGPRSGRIYNLVGGIAGWEGAELRDIPHLELFPRDMTLVQTLYRAMNMEKGAFLFYSQLAREYAGTELGDMALEMGEVEERHARGVFSIWHKQAGVPQGEPFAALFARLDGNVMEGGKPIAAWLAHLGRDDQDRKLRLLELACEIEYYAYDLYRGLANRDQAAETASTFLTLAEQEKGHIRIISKALRRVNA